MKHQDFTRRTDKQATPPCMYCGQSVNLEHDNAVTESREQPSSRRNPVQVWHRGCFDDFLDQGEET
ncbi:hypothetical protein [Petrachloros mirabilis]